MVNVAVGAGSPFSRAVCAVGCVLIVGPAFVYGNETAPAIRSVPDVLHVSVFVYVALFASAIEYVASPPNDTAGFASCVIPDGALDTVLASSAVHEMNVYESADAFTAFDVSAPEPAATDDASVDTLGVPNVSPPGFTATAVIPPMVAPATVKLAGTLVMVVYHIPMVEAAPPDSDPITICVHVLLSPEDDGGVSVALAVSDHAVTTH